VQFEYENTLHKVEGQLDILIIKIINNTRRGIEVKNLGTHLLGLGGANVGPGYKIMLSPMGTQVHMQEFAPNSRIPFLPNVKIAMPPLVLFIISIKDYDSIKSS
jgi:hypothetical protein